MNTLMPVAGSLPKRCAPRTPRIRRALQISGLTLAMTVLAGCDSGHQDLQTWMDETRQATPTVVEKVSEPKRFEPFRYRVSDQADPFSLGRLRIMVAAASSSSGASLQPDLARRREALESFPLDTLRMVGNLRQGNTQVALLKADTALYQVRVGHHIGQNFGRVTRISESGVFVRELVQDAAGDWVERITELQLQESGK
jgi:type IV pilus assembly protein PilP